MRKRSNAVHASSFDEYKTVSINKLATPPNSTSSPYQRPPVEQPAQEQPSETIRSSREKMRADPNLWKEFDFCAKRNQDRYENLENISQASTNEDGSLSSCESPLMRNSEEPGSRIPSKVFSVMTIGSQEAEVHGFLDGLFGENSGNNNLSNKKFDLVIKEHETNEMRYKLKFWIQDPSCQKHQAIINVYYATVQFYIFVYKYSSRQSFDCLAEAIERVKEKVKDNKFVGMLVCDSTIKPEDNVEVSQEEAEALCQKYGLIKGEKTDEAVQVTKKEVLKMVDRQPEVKAAENLMEKSLFRQEVV